MSARFGFRRVLPSTDELVEKVYGHYGIEDSSFFFRMPDAFRRDKLVPHMAKLLAALRADARFIDCQFWGDVNVLGAAKVHIHDTQSGRRSLAELDYRDALLLSGRHRPPKTEQLRAYEFTRRAVVVALLCWFAVGIALSFACKAARVWTLCLGALRAPCESLALAGWWLSVAFALIVAWLLCSCVAGVAYAVDQTEPWLHAETAEWARGVLDEHRSA